MSTSGHDAPWKYSNGPAQRNESTRSPALGNGTVLPTIGLLVVAILAGAQLALKTASVHSAASGPKLAIAWINVPARRTARVPPVLAQTTGASPCSAAGVTLTLGPEGAWQGSVTQNVEITNSGSAPCALPPAMTFTGTGSNGASGVFVSAQPIDTVLVPGEAVQLLLAAALACPGAGAATDPVLTTFTTTFGDGSQASLSGGSLDIACGSLSLLAFAPVQGVPLPSPSPTAHAIVARVLTNPLTLTPGQANRFVIRLTNRSARPYRFTSCPVYTISISASRTRSTTSFVLNCHAIKAIPSSSSVDFEMRAPVAVGMASGQAKLVWSLDGGTVTAAPVTVRSVTG